MILRPGKQHTCQVRLVFCLAVDHFQQQKKSKNPYPYLCLHHQVIQRDLLFDPQTLEVTFPTIYFGSSEFFTNPQGHTRRIAWV